MTGWLKCLGGPFDGKLFLPGDDIPRGGNVTITCEMDGCKYRRGYYVLEGGQLQWEEKDGD